MKLVPPTLEQIKDATLKREIEHAKIVGIPLRVAEANNIRLLERSEQIAKDAKKPAKKVESPAVARQKRHAERGITKRAASPIAMPKSPPCKHCGICRVCRRTKRALAIIHRRKESPSLDALALRMFVAALQAQTQIGKFKGLTKRDADRALTAEIESCCDASIRQLGAWM